MATRVRLGLGLGDSAVDLLNAGPSAAPLDADRSTNWTLKILEQILCVIHDIAALFSGLSLEGDLELDPIIRDEGQGL